ncbi:MAG: SAF domain-containing protein [Myxococcales bacterium]|nr:SAF domain-containing protein [Myxococcales bacterium]
MPPDIPVCSVTILLLLTACSPEQKVIAARRDLPAGEHLTLGDIVGMTRPETHAADEVIPVRQSASVIGAWLKGPVAAGEPIPADCCDLIRARVGSTSNSPRQRRLLGERRAARWACRPRPTGRRR